MALTSELAEFVAKTSFDNIPKPVVEATKLRIIDTIGAAWWGRREGDSKRIVSLIAAFGGNPEATVWGEKNVKLPCPWTAFLNGYTSIYMGDTCRFSSVHVGPVVIPAAVALGELKNSSGQDLITAVVVGYDVAVRIGRAMYPGDSNRGFHATGIIGPLGAAAAASKILGLDKEQTANAIAITAGWSSGVLEYFKSLESMALNMGRANQSGVLAALLAQKGFKGSDTIFEGGYFAKKGYLDAFAGEYSLELITKDLGKEYMIPLVAPKIHWGCRTLAGPIDAVMDIVTTNKLTAEDIEKINIKLYTEAVELERYPVKTRTDAIWSKRFGIAVAILTSEPVYPHRFTDEMVQDAKVQELIAKTNVEVDPELDKVFPETWPVIAEILTKDGKNYQCRLDFPMGEPENPVSKEGYNTKFRGLTEEELGAETAEKVISIVDNLETKKVSDLVSLLG